MKRLTRTKLGREPKIMHSINKLHFTCVALDYFIQCLASYDPSFFYTLLLIVPLLAFHFAHFKNRWIQLMHNSNLKEVQMVRHSLHATSGDLASVQLITIRGWTINFAKSFDIEMSLLLKVKWVAKLLKSLGKVKEAWISKLRPRRGQRDLQRLSLWLMFNLMARDLMGNTGLGSRLVWIVKGAVSLLCHDCIYV